MTAPSTVLPVWAKLHAQFADDGSLSRSVIGQDVVAAVQCGGGDREPRFLGRRVVAVRVDQQWPRRWCVVDAKEVAGQFDVVTRGW